MMSHSPAAERDETDPPQILLVNPASTPAPHKTFEPNIYPNLGLLTLGTALQRAIEKQNIAVSIFYYDGSLLGDEFIFQYIEKNADRLAVIGFSSVTLNYGACISMARHAKRCNRRIVNIIGNDHFSALYSEVMNRQQGVFDYGFCGNDVVEGFVKLVLGIITGDIAELRSHPGLVFRDSEGAKGVTRCPENPLEFPRLPLPNYALLDSLVPHAQGYQCEQQSFYDYVRDGGLRITVVEIARGCLKFGGPRNDGGVPLNACDFCGIIPGGQALAAQNARRAWQIIRNAFDYGYNYLFVTADELPSTFWALIKDMVAEIPEWYLDLHTDDRPRLMCYARADAFRDNLQERIDLLINRLGFDHFFVGLDGFTSHSLRAMNKGINRRANENDDLLHHNLIACREIARRGGRLSAGAVITHIGITPEILEANFQTMRQVLQQYPRMFVELDFELLCPIPGSLAFDYLRRPGMARARADALRVNVDDHRLEILHEKYAGQDELDPQELANDFIRGCCPDITVELAHEYLDRVRQLVIDEGVAYDCYNIATPRPG